MTVNVIFWILVTALVVGIFVLAVRKAAKDISDGNYHYSVVPGVPLIYGLGAGVVIVAMLMAVFAIGSITGFFEHYQIVIPLKMQGG